jgi:hypothetical protein
MGAVVTGLELAAPAVAVGDGRASVPVAQGWEHVIRHTTMIEQTFEKAKAQPCPDPRRTSR